MYLGSGPIVRHEEIKMTLMLDSCQADKHKEDVRYLTQFDTRYIQEGNKLYVTYTCSIHYFDDTVEKFEALIRLLNDPVLVVDAKLEEFEYGQCLIAELAQKIQHVIDFLKQRDK